MGDKYEHSKKRDLVGSGWGSEKSPGNLTLAMMLADDGKFHIINLMNDTVLYTCSEVSHGEWYDTYAFNIVSGSGSEIITVACVDRNNAKARESVALELQNEARDRAKAKTLTDRERGYVVEAIRKLSKD